MASEPLVSVIVPTYGRSRAQLRTAIDSVRKQTYDRLQLLVVDDSPDGVARWVESLDGLERVERLTAGYDGPGAARNAGIRAADGALLAFLDDDDWWRPTKLTCQVERQQATGAGVVFSGIERVRDGRPISRSIPPEPTDATLAILTGAPFPPFSAALVERSAAEATGLIDDRLRYLEDREWYLRLSRHGSVTRVPEPLVAYRLGGYDRLTADYEAARAAVERYYWKHRSTAADHGVEPAFRATLARNLTTSALRAGAYGEAREHALRAARAKPLDSRSLAYLLAAAGGEYSYRLGRSLNRTRNRLDCWLSRLSVSGGG